MSNFLCIFSDKFATKIRTIPRSDSLGDPHYGSFTLNFFLRSLSLLIVNSKSVWTQCRFRANTNAPLQYGICILTIPNVIAVTTVQRERTLTRPTEELAERFRNSFLNVHKITNFSIFVFLPPATKLGQGNIFRSLCQEFCPQVGGCLGRHPPREADTPSREAATPPQEADTTWEIRATSGRYASYWNAYLFSWCFFL